ncbi:MAG: chemotaxis protein CheX [Planctomycetota bacterium]
MPTRHASDTDHLFVNAARETFRAMLGLEIEPEAYDHGRGATRGYDVSAMIGLANYSREAAAQGSLVISMGEEVARRFVGRLLGRDDIPPLDKEVADGVGELVNVIAGFTKRGLAAVGLNDCRTSLPTVILGAQHRIFHHDECERTATEFSSDLGPFLLQILSMGPASTPAQPRSDAVS